jgi:hypothetical protein
MGSDSTLLLLYKKETQRGRMSCEDRHTDWVAASTNQGTSGLPTITRESENRLIS